MRTHKRFHDLWLSHVLKDPQSRLEEGRNAYAFRSAKMHESFRARAEELYGLAVKPRFQLKIADDVNDSETMSVD